MITIAQTYFFSFNNKHHFMIRQQAANMIILLLLFSGITSYGQAIQKNDYLVSFYDTIKDEYGYKNKKGDIIIPLGKYSRCFTHIFKTYAIVAKPNGAFIAIDRQENILYEIFPFENGPDYISDGFFRIVENNKIGFADAKTGKIAVKPQFECAWPFEKGFAKVSVNCNIQSHGEHTTWLSNNWFYIDKTGKKVAKPKTKKNGSF